MGTGEKKENGGGEGKEPLALLDEVHEVTSANLKTICSTTALTGGKGLPGDLMLYLLWQRDHPADLQDIYIVHGIAPGRREGATVRWRETKNGREEGRGRRYQEQVM
jgi:hypothetical protein